jgi:hypothetical protein
MKSRRDLDDIEKTVKKTKQTDMGINKEARQDSRRIRKDMRVANRHGGTIHESEVSKFKDRYGADSKSAMKLEMSPANIKQTQTRINDEKSIDRAMTNVMAEMMQRPEYAKIKMPKHAGNPKGEGYVQVNVQKNKEAASNFKKESLAKIGPDFKRKDTKKSMRVKENRKIARKKPLVTNTNASKMPRREETMGYKYIKKM